MSSDIQTVISNPEVQTAISDPEIITAIIGVIGTLAGTVLGAFLTYISQKGKLHLYVDSFTVSFKYNEEGSMVPCSSIEQAECFSYELVLDLYNSSSTTKIMRNLAIVFYDEKKKLFNGKPHEKKTKCHNNDIAVINIPPKSAIRLNLGNNIWQGSKTEEKDLGYLLLTKKVYLTYLNEKNQLKRHKVRFKSFETFLNGHKNN